MEVGDGIKRWVNEAMVLFKQIKISIAHIDAKIYKNYRQTTPDSMIKRSLASNS